MQGLVLKRGRDEHRHIVFASSVADHAYGNIGKAFEELVEHVAGFCDLVADDGHDGLSGFHFGRPERLEFADDLSELAVVVDGYGDGHFGGRHHVDRRFIFFEYLEDFAQESVGKQHPGALDIDGDDSVFGSNGFHA